MAYLKEIVQNLLFYYIIFSVVMSLVGNSSFKKYIEMFSGLVMIIIILNPLIKLFGVENSLDLNIRKNQLYEITKAESEDIMVAEFKQSDAVLKQYEEIIENQIRTVMSNHDYKATDVKVSIDDVLDSKTFGQIKSVEVCCQKGAGEPAEEASAIENVEIPEIKIQTKSQVEKAVEDTLETKDVSLEIASMYGLSVEDIKIQVKEDVGHECG